MADDANKNANNLKETLSEILFEQRNLADESRKFTKEVFESALQAQSAAKAFRDIANSTRDINREMGEVLSGEKAYDELQKDIVKQKTTQRALEVEATQAFLKMGYDLGDINSALNEQEGIWKLIDKSSIDLNNNQFGLASLYAQQLDSLVDQNSEMDELANRAKTIEGGLGISGKAAGGFSEILDKIGGGKFSKLLNIDGAVKDARKLSSVLTEGGKNALGPLGKSQVAGQLFSSMGAGLAKALGPIALIIELLKGIQQADKETTELGKSMAMTKGESSLFRENLAEAARDSGNMAVTGTKIVANFIALNKELGFINNFTMDTLVTMTKLTEQVGLSAKEAGGLVQLSEARGVNAEDEYKSALSISYELQKQSGIQQDLREILKGVSNVTGQLRANLRANTAELAKAVTLAGELGGTLDDVKTIGRSILDFESSIQNELSAELLTGKAINLEKSRQFALTGDIVGLEQEITSQLGTFTEFSKMSVIQQDALSKAFGLTSDKLSDMLFKQQLQGRSAKELRDAGEDDLARMVEQQSMQDKFNQTVEKLKAVFTDVGTAFMPVLEVLGFALSIVGAIVGFITDLLSMLKGDFDFSATSASLGTLGSQLGFDGGEGGSGYNSNGDRPGNSRSIPSNSNSESKRTNELLEKIASKDPQGLATSVGGSGGSSSKVESLLEQLVKKNSNVYMDSSKVGYAEAFSYSKL